MLKIDMLKNLDFTDFTNEIVSSFAVYDQNFSRFVEIQQSSKLDVIYLVLDLDVYPLEEEANRSVSIQTDKFGRQFLTPKDSFGTTHKLFLLQCKSFS